MMIKQLLRIMSIGFLWGQVPLGQGSLFCMHRQKYPTAAINHTVVGTPLLEARPIILRSSYYIPHLCLASIIATPCKQMMSLPPKPIKMTNYAAIMTAVDAMLELAEKAR